MATAADGPVLGVHDDLYSIRCLDVTSEAWNLRNDHDDLELLTCIVSRRDALDECLRDEVLYRVIEPSVGDAVLRLNGHTGLLR